MGALQREYNKGDASHDAEISVLCFVKCIEFVSATVVRMKQYDDFRKRLLDPDALDPDAGFIDDLLSLAEENRIFMKDSEAVRLTVERCCELRALIPEVPKFLAAYPGFKKGAKAADKKSALSEFAASLSATRNRIAHAKSNYEMTGKECPDEQMGEFAKCARLAAEQCIRWYADLNPSLRRA